MSDSYFQIGPILQDPVFAVGTTREAVRVYCRDRNYDYRKVRLLQGASAAACLLYGQRGGMTVLVGHLPIPFPPELLIMPKKLELVLIDMETDQPIPLSALRRRPQTRPAPPYMAVGHVRIVA